MSDPVLGRYELFRVVTDYEGLKEAFNDRIEDLDTPMSEIDTAADLTPGHVQKLLCKSNADWSRSFTWKTLGPVLAATGLALVLVIDDERFAAVKSRLTKRRRRNMPTIVSIRLPKWLISKKNAAKMRVLGVQSLSPRQRKRIARIAARARWKRPRESPLKQEVTANE